MDQEVLVKAGHLVVKSLGDEGAMPRAALWVHTIDTDTWKLWILPPKSLEDKREFYRRIAAIISKHRQDLGGIDIADIEMVTDKHPAIDGMRRARAFRVKGQSTIVIRNTTFNGYYLPEAIILEMDL